MPYNYIEPITVKEVWLFGGLLELELYHTFLLENTR